jgi:HEPN domain-containing protein
MDVHFPRKGDTVFWDADRQRLRATLVSTRWAGPFEFGLMAGGYKEASDALIKHLEASGRNDSLVYPILFGYRQYLELRIKALTQLVNRWDDADEEFKRTHDLQRLWKNIRSRLAEELQDEDRDAFQAAEALIMEFHELDPKSDRLRYPSDVEQLNLNLRRVQEVMERLSMFLDSMSDWWEAAIDARD